MLYKELSGENKFTIKLSLMLDFDIGQSYVTSKIIDRHGIIRMLNIQAGQRGLKLQKELCHLKNYENEDLPSYVYVRTMLKDRRIIIRKLPVVGVSDWMLIFEEDFFILAVKGLYDEIEFLG
ncbi:MAG TPA: hypothetical protein VN704_08490 [Verrucomicrobiae bacterium]|nr:hypothetical protein [Verrucomicrobiae bacterium]